VHACVCQQGLPFPFWNEEDLGMAANMVGRPLACDEQTFRGTQLDYA